MNIPGASAFAALSRRIRTLIIGGVAFLVLLALALTMPVPYVVLTPGPTYNTLGADSQGNTIIVINGTKQNKTTGNLNMTTVDVTLQKQTVFDVFSAWLASDQVVVPRSSIYPPGESQHQVDTQNTQDFSESQDNAVAASSCELGYPHEFGVSSVLSSGPSYNKLKPADIFETLNGAKITTSKSLLTALSKISAGSTVQLGILREGKATTVSIKLAAPLKGRAGGSLGIEPGSVCQLPFAVDLGLGNQIGGPSAGMMFSLGIMDKVGKIDLTHGQFIAGTGTIDPSGNVGAIGGIQLKMIAARRAGATVFLAPAGNCSDVSGAIPKGLDVIKVDTLHHAVQDLQNLHAGKAVPHC
ncbi:PDZ domain-containing protein [Jatrophihabitans sp.]|uniref:YlbL family protein n=1 Tax=Jatrophihabitans sp. TaxID=1932789 RepID=UPI0030C7035C|nr:Endopeptidase La [Jatrophihabitans sp.]